MAFNLAPPPAADKVSRARRANSFDKIAILQNALLPLTTCHLVRSEGSTGNPIANLCNEREVLRCTQDDKTAALYSPDIRRIYVCILR